MAALGTAAIKNYADFEQLSGGVETLFKTSADSVMEYANRAYETAGMSANKYMETVTSFSASLLQSLDGDTQAAADAADQAIIDMSDNANKMGSSMESIQNAYQGFAKQNYTMLDNLKLGYGGTKTEMQRLLKDAEKISGIKYDIGNLSDVYSAIHVIQEEMGITGTTAKEASTTISGSLGMVKASFSNLLTGVADDSQDFDKLVNDFVDSVSVAGKNILPRVEIAITGTGKLIEKLLPAIINRAPKIINNVLPQLIKSGVNMVESVVIGMEQNLPEIMTGAMEICNVFINSFLEMLPLLIDLGLQVISQIAIGIAQSLPTLIPAIVDILLNIVDTLINNIDLLVDAAIQLMIGLTEGLLNALPILIERLPEIIMAIVNELIENAPKLLGAAGEIIAMLIKGLFEFLPQLLIKLPEIVSNIIDKLVENAPNLIRVGTEFIGSIATGLLNAVPELLKKIPGIVSNIIGCFNKAIKGFVKIGGDIVEGIWKGISEGWDWLIDKVTGLAGSLYDKVKKFLGINSPSKKFKWIGEMCVAGWDEGSKGLLNVDPHMNRVKKSLDVMKANSCLPAYGENRRSFTQVVNINQPISTPDEMAREMRLESRYGLMKDDLVYE